jgi:hypothetical protein
VAVFVDESTEDVVSLDAPGWVTVAGAAGAAAVQDALEAARTEIHRLERELRRAPPRSRQPHTFND